MTCQDVQPFVSALHDGETVSSEAAEHIRGCPACRERLRQYAEMGAEVRLVASAASGHAPAPLPTLPPRRWQWTRPVTARVLIPRFAVGLGIFAIVGLSVGLGLMRAQITGLWFQFNVSSLDKRVSWGNEVQAGYHAPGPGFVMAGPNAKVGAMIDVLEVQYGLVRLAVRARRFEIPSGGEVSNGAPENISRQELDQKFRETPVHEYQYVPGQTLEIPVEGGGKILLTGRVLERRASFWGYPLEPKPDEIVLTKPILLRDKEVLGKEGSSASGEGGDNPYVAIAAPGEGLFVFLLKPVDGTVEGEVEYGQARFKLDGHEYLLLCATPITGGEQPRQIWVYHDPNYPPPGQKAVFGISSGGGNLEKFLERLKK